MTPTLTLAEASRIVRDAVKEIRPELGYRLAALADGEGCFSIFPRVPRLPHHDAHWGVLFKIHLRGDDGPLLERLRGETGLGRVNYGEYKKQRGMPWAAWSVQAKRECMTLVDIFDEYPLWSKKAGDFAIWRQAVIYAQSPQRKPNGRYDWSPLAAWRDELRSVREYR